MHTHTAAVQPVADASYLILVDGMPVHHTSSHFAARLMADRLQRLFDESCPLDFWVVNLGGIYAVRCRRIAQHRMQSGRPVDTDILEMKEEQTPFACLQASVVAENLRAAVCGSRQQKIPITLKPITILQKVTRVITDNNVVAEDQFPDLEIILEQYPTEHGTVVLYKKLVDARTAYAGLITATEMYDLIAATSLQSLEQVSISVVNLLQDTPPFLRIEGVFGAKALRTHYFRLKDGEPQLLLELDGHGVELDINNDLNKEIVLTKAIPPTTRIFVWVKDHFEVAHVNEILNAVAVMPHEADPTLFDAYLEHPKDVEPTPSAPATGEPAPPLPLPLMKTYKYQGGHFSEVEIPASS